MFKKVEFQFFSGFSDFFLESDSHPFLICNGLLHSFHEQIVKKLNKYLGSASTSAPSSRAVNHWNEEVFAREM
jgi:hypothetical protein